MYINISCYPPFLLRNIYTYDFYYLFLEGKKSNFFLDGGIGIGIINIFVEISSMLTTVDEIFIKTHIQIFTGMLNIDNGHSNYSKSGCCNKIDGA